jgi:hypothetical protein
VKKALGQAEAQLAAYRRTLEKRYGDALDLRAWSVVAVGFERLVARPFAAGSTDAGPR